MKNPTCPSTIFVEITNICNFDCTFCPNHLMTRKKGMMDFELFKKIALDARACGIKRFLLWIMGEPFLHPRFFEFARFAKEHNLELSLITNGGLLKVDLINRFLDLKLSDKDELLVSYLTPNPCAFGLRKAGALDFDTYKQGIYKLIERKIATRGKVKIILIYMINIFGDVVSTPGVITNADDALGHIRELSAFAEGIKRKEGVDFRVVIPSKKQIETNIKNCREIKREILPGVFFQLKWLTNWGKVILPDGLRVVPSQRGYCAYPFETLGIFWDGQVTLCCDDYEGALVVGDTKEQSIGEIFNSEKARRIRSDMDEGRLTMPRCQICQGVVIDKEGKVLRNYYKKYYLGRVFRHLRVHGLKKTVSKILAELKANPIHKNFMIEP